MENVFEAQIKKEKKKKENSQVQKIINESSPTTKAEIEDNHVINYIKSLTKTKEEAVDLF